MTSTDPFSDPQAVARYADGPPRLVPGFAHLQRMVTILLAERMPRDGRVLVVGAGGGLEIKVFAEAHAQWRFDGVDPSAEMLKLAEATLGSLASRARLHLGYIDAAPDGPFDAATCLLTLHFVALEERRRTLREIKRRLKSGAPFVVAHLSFPQSEAERALWLSRRPNRKRPCSGKRGFRTSPCSTSGSLFVGGWRTREGGARARGGSRGLQRSVRLGTLPRLHRQRQLGWRTCEL